MTTEPFTTSNADPARPETIELPRPTIAPLILVAGLSFAAAGLAFATTFFLVVRRGDFRRRADRLDRGIAAGTGPRPSGGRGTASSAGHRSLQGPWNILSRERPVTASSCRGKFILFQRAHGGGWSAAP